MEGWRVLLWAIIAFFAAAGIYFVLQCIKQALLRKIQLSNKLRVDTLVSVYGEAPELEMLLKNLRAREGCGNIYLRICSDDGKTKPEAEKLAAIKHIEIIN